jgi:hypothetical protein
MVKKFFTILKRPAFLAPTILVLVLLTFYFAFVNFIDKNEVGIAYNWITGELWLQDTASWKLTSPSVSVSRIDTRPVRVCITTAARAFNCKLVQFEPRHYEEFVATEGFYYYWWANRLSFNFGYREEYRGMKDILRGYAFSPTQYPFLKILQEHTPGE